MLTRLRARRGAASDAELANPLDLQAITFAIAGETILSGVSLAVRQREILCLLGPSGCGKTTLLRIAAGIERQSSGVVSVAGHVVADDTAFVPAEKRRLGLVFQDLALFPHMRIAQNVAYGLKGIPRTSAEARAATALKSVGLAGTERAYPHQLSGGEQQRVALARALLPAPPVVLFDEPFSALDRGLRESVRAETLALLRERRATAVIVTHDAQEALAMADRIALMREGAIVQVATPEEIWRWPVDLAAARVFSPVNTFTGRVHDGGVTTVVGRIPVGPGRDGERLTVAFRPEAIGVFPADRADAGSTEARVLERRFFGSYVELQAAIGQTPLTLRAAPYLVPHAPTVRVVPDLRQAIVLPAED